MSKPLRLLLACLLCLAVAGLLIALLERFAG